jgi:hypothetical protein
MKTAFPEEFTPGTFLELSMTASLLDMFDEPAEIEHMRQDWEERVEALEAAGYARASTAITQLARARDLHLEFVRHVRVARKSFEDAKKGWDTNPQRMLRRFQRDCPDLAEHIGLSNT